MGRQPPKRITGAALEAADVGHVGETRRNLASSVAHLAFGGGMGAVFAVLRARLKPPGPALAQGLAYGMGVWAVSYKGWIPALGLMPPPERDLPGRQRTTVGAHLLYGGVLGLLEGRPA